MKIEIHETTHLCNKGNESYGNQTQAKSECKLAFHKLFLCIVVLVLFCNQVKLYYHCTFFYSPPLCYVLRVIFFGSEAVGRTVFYRH